MKQIQKKDILLLVAQLLLMSLIVLSPSLVNYLTTSDPQLFWESLGTSVFWLTPPAVVYLFNFYLLVPQIWFKQRYVLFILVNAAVVTLCNTHILFNDVSSLPNNYQASYKSFASVGMLVNLMAIGIALSIRYVMLQNEKRQKNIEAELAWLKNQINPHFHFNTLNNISRLTQIDADEAQDAVMQLSDLLRYAMYETNKLRVPIGGEVDFMQNYIELMKLRCNDKTEISAEFTIQDPKQEIAPMLFLSLIENAFKHGVDSNMPATISIRLVQEEGRLIFTCDNTNNPKPTNDRSGSGIGLENTRRRLDLLYKGHYLWEQTVTPDNTYHTKITLET